MVAVARYTVLQMRLSLRALAWFIVVDRKSVV